MISVLLLGFRGGGDQAVPPGEVVRTLAALVPAAVEGIVRDVCLVAPTDSQGLADVADHAGCAFAAAPSFTAAVSLGSRQLRSNHVLVAQGGMVVDRPLVEELLLLLPTLDTETRGFYIVRAERRDFLGRLIPALAPAAALLGPRAWLGVAAATDFARLVREATPRRVMAATAWMGD